VESSSVTTIPVIPYTIILATAFLIVALSYAHTVPLNKVLPRWDDYRDAWVLYSAEQLHRDRFMEKMGGNAQMMDTNAAGPTAATHNSGSGEYLIIYPLAITI
jgi:hypothetical protein